MRTLNILDLVYQTFFLGATTLLSLVIVLTGNPESVLMVALYGAFFLGPWQLVSAIATCIARGLYFRLRVIYLLSSIIYILIFCLVAAFLNVDLPDWVEIVGGVLGFAIPPLLAVSYYGITVKTFQLARAHARAATQTV